MRSLRLACLLVAATLGCHEQADGVADAGPDGSVEYEPFEPSRCDGSSALPLTSIPSAEQLSFFYQLNATCKQLSSLEIVLLNTSDASVQIDSARTDGKPFYVVRETFPRTLSAGERLKVQLQFLPEKAGEYMPTLSVMGPDGCLKLPLHGRALSAGEDGLTTFQPYVMDFGSVQPGEQSAAQELIVMEQLGPGREPAKFEGPNASSEEFHVLSPFAQTKQQGCTIYRASVAFVGPPTPGITQGSLAWTVSSTVDDVIFEGIQVMDLVGSVE